MASDRQDRPGRTSGLEWTVGIAGALIVAAAITFLIVEAFRGEGRPPDIRVVADPPLTLNNGWLVRITLHNEGGSTAANLLVAGELRGPEGTAQRSEVEFDYLPPKSTRTGGLFFSEDPRRYELSIRPLSYIEP